MWLPGDVRRKVVDALDDGVAHGFVLQVGRREYQLPEVGKRRQWSDRWWHITIVNPYITPCVFAFTRSARFCYPPPPSTIHYPLLGFACECNTRFDVGRRQVVSLSQICPV